MYESETTETPQRHMSRYQTLDIHIQSTNHFQNEHRKAVMNQKRHETQRMDMNQSKSETHRQSMN